MKKFFKQSKRIYWWLIGTFAALYLAVAFVSTLHAITFFQLANSFGLAILLGAAYEVGQASVLFSILMSQNKNKFLAWSMMFLLTALQVTANVYASFKFMDASGSTDWTYWQRAILFGVQADSPETYKVIISWISGALLPLVALGMTALVADQIKMLNEPDLPIIEAEPEEEEDDDTPLFGNLFKKKKKDEAIIDPLPAEEDPGPSIMEEPDIVQEIGNEIEKLKKSEQELKDKGVPPLETESFVIKEPVTVDLQDMSEHQIPDFLDEKAEIIPPYVSPPVAAVPEVVDAYLEADKANQEPDKKPVNKMRGWHLMTEFVDDEHNVFNKGKFIMNIPTKTPTSKKA